MAYDHDMAKIISAVKGLVKTIKNIFFVGDWVNVVLIKWVSLQWFLECFIVVTFNFTELLVFLIIFMIWCNIYKNKYL